MSPLPVLLALTPLLGPAGCDGPGSSACTEIGCSGGYTVSLVAPGRFPGGVRRVRPP